MFIPMWSRRAMTVRGRWRRLSSCAGSHSTPAPVCCSRRRTRMLLGITTRERWSASGCSRSRSRRFERQLCSSGSSFDAAGRFPRGLRDADSKQLVLEGTRAVLIEFPGHSLGFKDDSALTLEAADILVEAGLVPIVAHPERSIGLQADFAVARALVEQGCLLCPNGDSALGDNGPQPRSCSGGCSTKGSSR